MASNKVTITDCDSPKHSRPTQTCFEETTPIWECENCESSSCEGNCGKDSWGSDSSSADSYGSDQQEDSPVRVETRSAGPNVCKSSETCPSGVCYSPPGKYCSGSYDESSKVCYAGCCTAPACSTVIPTDLLTPSCLVNLSVSSNSSGSSSTSSSVTPSTSSKLRKV